MYTYSAEYRAILRQRKSSRNLATNALMKREKGKEVSKVGKNCIIRAFVAKTYTTLKKVYNEE